MMCDDRNERLGAFLDGELSSTDIAELTQHLKHCSECVNRLAELGALRAAIAEAIPEEEASTEFLARVTTALDKAVSSSPAAVPQPAQTGHVIPLKPRARPKSRLPFAAGFLAAALAAMAVLTLLPSHDKRIDLSAVRDAALRSGLSAGGITDGMAMTAPGYQLRLARADIIAGHAAQVRVFARGTDTFTLCVWKANREPAHGVVNADVRAMRISYWNDGTNEYWVASVSAPEALQRFVATIRQDAT